MLAMHLNCAPPKKASLYSKNARIDRISLHIIEQGCMGSHLPAHRHSIQFSISFLGEKLGIPNVVGVTLELFIEDCN
jgi:hypothetical protein